MASLQKQPKVGFASIVRPLAPRASWPTCYTDRSDEWDGTYSSEDRKSRRRAAERRMCLVSWTSLPQSRSALADGPAIPHGGKPRCVLARSPGEAKRPPASLLAGFASWPAEKLSLLPCRPIHVDDVFRFRRGGQDHDDCQTTGRSPSEGRENMEIAIQGQGRFHPRFRRRIGAVFAPHSASVSLRTLEGKREALGTFRRVFAAFAPHAIIAGGRQNPARSYAMRALLARARSALGATGVSPVPLCGMPSLALRASG
jgi:hypothetical protein